jgi:hypothetical protein
MGPKGVPDRIYVLLPDSAGRLLESKDDHSLFFDIHLKGYSILRRSQVAGCLVPIVGVLALRSRSTNLSFKS